MNTLVLTVAAQPGQGSTLTAFIIPMVVLALVAACLWGVLRVRSAAPIFGKDVSDTRTEAFAAEVLREFESGTPSGLPGQLRAGAKTGLVPAPSAKGRASFDGLGPLDRLADFYPFGGPVLPGRAGVEHGAGNAGGLPGSELSESFRSAVEELVGGIESLSTTVRQTALFGGGSEVERAGRCVEAFTRGMGALPLGAVLAGAKAASLPAVSPVVNVGLDVTNPAA